MFLHIRLAIDQTLDYAMTSPVKQTSESPSDHRHWQVLRETEKYHAESRAEKASQKHFLSANSITETAPEYSADAFGECKGRCDHAHIHGECALIFCNAEVFDHVVGVWKYGHESNRLAYPA
jgi:hypothetical protein